MPANTTELERRLWGVADEFRANSKLKSSEYSVPVLGLIFLRYADHKFTQAKAKFTSQFYDIPADSIAYVADRQRSMSS
jgi:type I restriction enzyme M protein